MQAKETTVQKMLTGTKVFLVPLFQRRYKWAKRDWDDLWGDILDQYYSDDVLTGSMREGEGHFLGSVVLHPAPGPASTVARYLVIDGQQRLTTLLILLAALRDLRRDQEEWRPEAYDHQYLGNPFNPEEPHRLVPGRLDAEAFRRTVFDGVPTGQQGRAYRYFTSAIDRLLEEDGQAAFARLERTILLRLLLVDISTSPSDNVNHIFHTLNYNGQKLSALDLVRNRIFMTMPPESVESAYIDHWQPMETLLGESEMQRYVWAQCARRDARATQKDLYPAFERWVRDRLANGEFDTRSLLPELEELHRQSVLYGAIQRPPSADEEQTAALSAPVTAALRELADWGSATHLPATLECLIRLDEGRSSETDVVTTLGYFLSFMVRRALANIPTNNLNRIFSGLPSVLRDGELAPQVAQLLLGEQRYWPSDTEVLDRIGSTPLYATIQPSQVRYVLRKLEFAIPGPEVVSVEGLEVEHVMPQKLTASWVEYLEGMGDSADRARGLVHTIGNLTLTGQNEQLARLSFDRKRDLYRDSLVRLSQAIVATEYWSLTEIERRSRALGQAAIEVWERPDSSSNTELPQAEDVGLLDVLFALGESEWTTPDVLAEFLGVPVGEVLSELGASGPELQVKVLTEDAAVGSWVAAEMLPNLVRQLSDSGFPTEPPVYESAPLSIVQVREVMDKLAGPRDD